MKVLGLQRKNKNILKKEIKERANRNKGYTAYKISFVSKKSKFRSAPSLDVHTIDWFISDYENAVYLDYGMFPCQKQHFYAPLGFVIYYLGTLHS